jgi:hypothetical protein
MRILIVSNMSKHYRYHRKGHFHLTPSRSAAVTVKTN